MIQTAAWGGAVAVIGALSALTLYGCNTSHPGGGTSGAGHSPSAQIFPDRFLALTRHSPAEAAAERGRGNLKIWGEQGTWEFFLWFGCEGTLLSGSFDVEEWQELTSEVPWSAVLALHGYPFDPDCDDRDRYMVTTTANMTTCIADEAISDPVHRGAFDYLVGLYEEKEQEAFAAPRNSGLGANWPAHDAGVSWPRMPEPPEACQ